MSTTISNIDEALQFLQRKFSQVELDRNDWIQQRELLLRKLEQLQKDRAYQDSTHRDLILRIKMLEYALRRERINYMTSNSPPRSIESNPSNVQGAVRRAISRLNSTSSAGSSPRSLPRSRPTSPVPENIPDIQVSKPIQEKSPITKQVTSTAIKGKKFSLESCSASKVVDNVDKMLKMKLKLSGHLDAVRKTVFHPMEPILASSSDDGTVKIWNLCKSSSAKRGVDIDPMITLRGHPSGVYAIGIIASENLPSGISCKENGICVSGGLDGSIAVWNLPLVTDPSGSSISYEEYQAIRLCSKKDAHDDAIWDIQAHPASNHMMSVGADTSVRIWSIDESQIHMKLKLKTSSNDFHDPGHHVDGFLQPSSVTPIYSDMKTLMVGYTSASLAQFDIDAGKNIQFINAPANSAHGRTAQVNQVVAHQSMPLVIAAHQDNSIRFYDLRTGKCVHTIVAHQEAVTSIALDDAGLYLVSGGHDGSLRYWSMSNRTCLHEQSVHRHKYSDAVHTVCCHQSRGFVATGGADCLIKIFQ